MKFEIMTSYSSRDAHLICVGNEVKFVISLENKCEYREAECRGGLQIENLVTSSYFWDKQSSAKKMLYQLLAGVNPRSSSD